MKSQIIGVSFLFKDADEQGNYIQPSVKVKHKNKKYRIFLPNVNSKQLVDVIGDILKEVEQENGRKS